jgi:hypothetical protein
VLAFGRPRRIPFEDSTVWMPVGADLRYEHGALDWQRNQARHEEPMQTELRSHQLPIQIHWIDFGGRRYVPLIALGRPQCLPMSSVVDRHVHPDEQPDACSGT